jgi:hypothetical protein
VLPSVELANILHLASPPCLTASDKRTSVQANNAQPRAALSGNVHDVGRLRYSEAAERVCTLENDGEARFRFLHCACIVLTV